MANDTRPRPDADQDEDEVGRYAADEPTAVWDANALREAGLSELSNVRHSEPAPAATPGTEQGPSIVVDEAATGGKAKPVHVFAQVNKGRAGGDVGWAGTLGLAVVLGGIVYALIRFLR